MKKIIMVSCLILCLFGCQSTNRNGIDFSKGELIEKTDSHSGFHGDSTLLEIQEFDEKLEAELIQNNWQSLPIDEDLKQILKIVSIDEINNMLTAKNGYYYFEDCHSEYKENESYDDILKRHSFNYTFAVYSDQRAVVVEVDRQIL